MKYIGSSTSEAVTNVDAATLKPDQRQFRAARFELLDRLNKNGHYGCLVLVGDYLGKGNFSRHWYPTDAQSLAYEERGPITISALYDKAKLMPADLPHITDAQIVNICWDKARTRQLLGDLQAKAFILHTPGDLTRLAELDNGSGMVVVKSFTGFGGDNVRIGPITQLQTAKNLPPFPLLAEEFIETSAGVPGLVQGRHDVRVIIINGEPIGGSVRTPATGGLLSNTHQGGSMRMLGVAELPAQLLNMATKVDAELPQRPRLYAADFMYSKPQDKWFLVELNSSPGMLPSSLAPVGPEFQQKLYDALVKMA